jgi:hypothetical protein
MTNNITGVKSPFQFTPNKSFATQEIKHPIREAIESFTGVISLNIEVQEDKVTLNTLKHIPGLVSYICILRNNADGSVIGIGRGTSVINPHLSKYIDRTVRVAFNSAIIDSVIHSTKMLNMLKPCNKDKPLPTKEVETEVDDKEEDLEGRDRICSYSADSTLKQASEKQKAFLKTLIETKCTSSSKPEYLSQLNEKYLSSYQASELISSLLPM